MSDELSPEMLEEAAPDLLTLEDEDGKEVTFTWDNQSANPENAEPAQPVQFIGNVNSHKFHAPDCANLPTEKNRIIFGTYEQAIDAGYTPCGSCLG
mgnify:CR=1 FL=1